MRNRGPDHLTILYLPALTVLAEAAYEASHYITSSPFLDSCLVIPNMFFGTLFSNILTAHFSQHVKPSFLPIKDKR
jgi:hypothetical protein